MNPKLSEVRAAIVKAVPEIETAVSPTNERADNGYKIQGRPIRLADVLLAIGKTNCPKHKTFSHLALDMYGEFYDSDKNQAKVLATWNLRQDDLTLQNPATIDFLHSILCSV